MIPRCRRDDALHHLRHRLIAVGLTCAAGFVVLAAEATSGAPNRIDRLGADVFMAASRYSKSYRLAEVVSIGGSPVFVVLAAIGLAALAWSLLHDRRLVALCIVAPAVAGLLQLATKHLVGPQRPLVVDPWFRDRTLAFPSGHATGAASIATVVVVLAYASAIPRSSRWAVVMLAVGYAVAVAASRVVLDDHLAMDAIGGLLLGVAVSALGGAVAIRHAHAVGARAADRAAS